MGKNRNARHRKNRGGRLTPRQADQALQLIEGVTVDGEPFAFIAWECTDPACPEHRG